MIKISELLICLSRNPTLLLLWILVILEWILETKKPSCLIFHHFFKWIIDLSPSSCSRCNFEAFEETKKCIQSLEDLKSAFDISITLKIFWEMHFYLINSGFFRPSSILLSNCIFKLPPLTFFIVFVVVPPNPFYIFIPWQSEICTNSPWILTIHSFSYTKTQKRTK